MIYKQFKIANQTITTELLESLPDSQYGDFNDAKNLIRITKSVKIGEETIPLTFEQIENTWWHELFHAFQFYFNNEYDEAQSQTYANFMRELLSSGTTIDKNEY